MLQFGADHGTGDGEIPVSSGVFANVEAVAGGHGNPTAVKSRPRLASLGTG